MLVLHVNAHHFQSLWHLIQCHGSNSVKTDGCEADHNMCDEDVDTVEETSGSVAERLSFGMLNCEWWKQGGFLLVAFYSKSKFLIYVNDKT